MKRNENFTIAGIVKTIRIANNLTQESFAKLFFVTKNTISHYENGTRVPNINFLLKVCEYFDLPLTYFQKGYFWKKKSFSNLIISKEPVSNKLGLYDIASETFILPHDYDNILISSTGYHIATQTSTNKFKFKVFDYSGKECLKIKENFIIGDYAFNDFGTVIAKLKTTSKFCLIDYNNKQLSKEYSKIVPFKLESKMLDFSNYICYDLENNTTDLIYFNGEIIKTFYKIIDTNFKYLKNIEEIKEIIENFGSSMFCFIDEEVFKEPNNYPKIIESIDKHIEKILNTVKPFNKDSKFIFIKESLIIIINLITKAQKIKAFKKTKEKIEIKEKEYILNLINNTSNTLAKNGLTKQANQIKKYETELYKLIGLL